MKKVNAVTENELINIWSMIKGRTISKKSLNFLHKKLKKNKHKYFVKINILYTHAIDFPEKIQTDNL